jgi:hypothetical protein
LIYLCHLLPGLKNQEKYVLFCRVQSLVSNEVESFLEILSEKIFLAAPPTQVFLFLPLESRKTLFKAQNNNYNWAPRLIQILSQIATNPRRFSSQKSPKWQLIEVPNYNSYPAQLLIRCWVTRKLT